MRFLRYLFIVIRILFMTGQFEEQLRYLSSTIINIGEK